MRPSQQRGGTRGGDHLVGFGIAVQCIAEESRHCNPLRLGQRRDVIGKAFAQQPALDGLGFDEQLGHRGPFGLELMLPVRLHDGALELRPGPVRLAAEHASPVERQRDLQRVMIVPVRSAVASADPQAAALPQVHPPDGKHAPTGLG